MRTRLLLVTSALLVLSACGRQEAGEPGRPGDEWPAGRSFLVTELVGHQLVPGTKIELRFTDQGQVAANAGCNHLGGAGRIVDGALVVSEMGGTDMACDPPRMAQDTWVVKFLGARPSFSLDGDQLTLKTDDATMRLTDREVVDPDRQLVGTRWTLDTLVTGDAASSLPQGVTAYLVISVDGRMSGNAGCNDFTGTAKVSGSKITFSDLGTTKKACPGAAGGVESTVHRMLDGDAEYEIDAQTLRLTKAGGTGMVFRASQ